MPDIDCPRAKSFMTPCIARDGHTALGDSPDITCIGCSIDPREAFKDLAERYEPARRHVQVKGYDQAADLLQRFVAEYVNPRRTCMPDLTDFLLARIGDEEAQMAWTPIEIWPSRRRVLAECEAKKAIIAACVPNLTAGGGYDEEAILAKTILLSFAQVHADHPGFDPSWRVD